MSVQDQHDEASAARGAGTLAATPAFRALPLGSIAPGGWLRDQLRLQGDGLTGRLDEIWPDVGPASAWLGGRGEDWERGPYYCDGLVPLAFLLDDQALMAKARRWMDAVLASQREDGQFGPPTNDDWWPRMVMLKALAHYQEATGDPRVIPFMTRYFRYQRAALPSRPLRDWGRARGADNVLSVYWLYERTNAAWLLDLAGQVLAQTTDWGAYLTAFPCKERQTAFSHFTHVVNVAMGLKAPAVRYLRDGRAEHLRAVDAAIENLMRYHGQVQGMFSGDEWLAGLDPAQGVELCAVVECLFSLHHLVRIIGAGRFADRLESIAYNALAATITADMRAHQYDQQPNQVLCTVAPRQWTQNSDASNTFGLEPHFGCCTANLHQGWPTVVQSLWMGTPDGGLAATVYAPCAVRARVRGDATITIDETTDYPFGETVRFTIRTEHPMACPLLLRIPAWCADPRARVNGAERAIPASGAGFMTIEEEWRDGDEIELMLPMRVRALQRPRGAIGIALGPLVFGLEIAEEWTRIPGSPAFGDWEVRPRSPWNYALALDPARPDATCRVDRRGVAHPPFGHDQAALRLHATAHRVPDWGLVRDSAGPPPFGPVRPPTPAEAVTLLPYGCARLRIAEFPYILPGSGSDQEPRDAPVQTVAADRTQGQSGNGPDAPNLL